MKTVNGEGAGRTSRGSGPNTLRGAIARLEAQLEEAGRRKKELEDSIQTLGDGPKPEQFGLTEAEYQRTREREGSDYSLPIIGIGLSAALFLWFVISNQDILMASPGRLLGACFACILMGSVLAIPLWILMLVFSVFFPPLRYLLKSLGQQEVKDKRYLAYTEAVSVHRSKLVSLKDELKNAEETVRNLHTHVQSARLRQKREYWFGLSGQRFEEELGEVFRKLGYITEVTPGSGDFGVDIRIQRKDGKKGIIQCKAHRNAIGPGPVRELFGVLTHEGAEKAFLFCLGGFTQGAMDFAKGKPIELADVD